MDYKVIFIADEVLAHSEALLKSLSPEFRLFKSQIHDEFRQVFFQTGKFLVFFSDPKKAVVFQKSPTADLQGIDYEVVLYLKTDSKFKPDSQKIIEESRIKVFHLSEARKLLDFAKKYFEESGSPEDELEFISDTKLSTEE